MTLNDFLCRFTLNSLQNSNTYLKQQQRQAAVLVPLVPRESGVTMLLTQRAFHLRHHPGQVSFPGGKIEQEDASPQAAALRETEEEIGIPAKLVNILGSLGTYQTSSKFHVQPIVALVQPEYQLRICEDEVSDVFEVPLSFLLNDTNRYQFQLPYKKKKVTVHAMPFEGKLIWGATAMMINDLLNQIK
jgi:8-oxo-dGTP pyrophosphatase MutT (NUDIX family)